MKLENSVETKYSETVEPSEIVVQSETTDKPNKKVSRRGITNETKGATSKKFNDSDAKYFPDGNVLFSAVLAEVTIRNVEYKQGTASQFVGMSVPQLTFHFKSISQNPNAKDDELKHYYHTIFPVESSVDTIPGGSKEWAINSTMMFMKHILDVYHLKGGSLTNEEAESLTLEYEDFDEFGQYVPIEPQEVVDGWSKLFNNYVEFINTKNNGKSILMENGRPRPIWLKLLRYVKKGGKSQEWIAVNNGEFGLPSIVGEGLIELQTKANPLIRYNITKEDIKHRIIKEKTEAASGMGVPTIPPMPTFQIPQSNYDGNEQSPF